MFRTKKDVERHVSDVVSKIDNENEKYLRGYTFARLFFQVKDYESAKKYLAGFLSIRDHHAASHKLMAQIYDATGNPEYALQSYKRSLEIDPHQNDIVLKICELYCQVSVDHETARYWADRTEQLYPHHETVFKLREYLVSAEGEPDRKELENLIATELSAQPKNIDLRIKLLRLYLDTERVKEAYSHATLIESKRLFPHSVEWYYLLGDIFEAYQEEFEELDSQFYIHYLTALDHLISLTLAEPHINFLENGIKPSSLDDAAAVLQTYDQLLKKVVEKDTKDNSWAYFVHHMKGQLYFHMTSLLMKKAKLDQGNRKEAFRFSAGLAIVCYSFKPINMLQEVWFSQMEDNQKAFTNYFQQGTMRTSFIGHVILSMCKEDTSAWLHKIKTEVCILQVKERIYSRIFASLLQKEKLSSYFITDSTFEQCSLELPSGVVLKEYDKSASKLCPHSLHHLVWLELHGENCFNISQDIIAEIFKNLQYSNKNLSKGSCESLCILDLEAYLCATVYQSKLIIERRSNVLNTRNCYLLSYPPDICDALCTNVQALWWKAAHGLYTCAIKEKLGEHRRNLQHGLEVIRGIGSHGMEVQLVIYLAQIFFNKADTLNKNSEKKMDKNKNNFISDTVTALYSRASHYWNIALGMLDKLSSGQTLKTSKDPMFAGSGKVLSKSDIKVYQEEGQLFLAVRLMDFDKLNEAAELLSKLSSPYGSFYLSQTLMKLASQESKHSSQRIALLNKAKTSLHDTMDRIKDDKSHPLNKKIFIELEDVENELAHELSITNNSCEDADETDAYDVSSFHITSYTQPENDKSAVHSTPRPSANFITSKRLSAFSESPTQHFEPSPERLDAQVRALALNQDNLMKAFLQQQETLLETNRSIVDALRQNKDVVEQLKKQLEELSLTAPKYHSKTLPKKLNYLKGQGEEEEEYYDPSTILEYFEDGGEKYRTARYSFDQSARLVHDATPGASAPINYVVPSVPPPALNHYNYQYPPHAVLPTPPSAVAEHTPYYHPPPGQGLPFSEGQQLPQFHFHVASSIVKPPAPPTLTTSLPQVIPPGLPPVSVPPPSVVIPAAAPLVQTPWPKAVTVPHAFQIPLPNSKIFVSTASVVAPTSTVLQSPSIPVTTNSHSQLKDLLQTPVSRTITFGQPSTATVQSTVTSPSSFSVLSKTSNTLKDLSRCDSENAVSPDVEGHDLEREVMGDFKPLIPLPAEIVVETGEENEVILFEDKAKLYRFVAQEWKERGIGVVKILHHKGSGRVRLLMRRDQVLKVCANHRITSNMKINPLKNSDRAWTWVAQDFADEEFRPEYFCIRFKVPETATIFKNAFDKAINISREVEAQKVAYSKENTIYPSQKLFGENFLPKAGSWTCPTCYIVNLADKLKCAACETNKPGSETVIATSVAQTISLGTETKSSFQTPPSTSSYIFEFPIATCSTITVTSTVTTTTSSKSIVGGFTFTSSPIIQEAKSPEIKDREILVVSTKSKDGPQVTKVNAVKTSPFTGFSFKSPSDTTTTSTSQLSAITTASSLSGFTGFQTTNSQASTPANVSPSLSSQSNVSTTKSIGISTIQTSMQNISPAFTFPKTSEKVVPSPNQNKNLNVQSNAPESLFVHVSSDGRRVSTDGIDGTPEEFIPTAEFKPVVPLPALVDIKTGEEGEEKLFGERAKLFRFDSETKEWKERGIGELKVLFLKESHKYRILMRREQVLKLCANHYILPDMILTPLNNSDRAWIWIANDYSDGEMATMKLAVKFKTSDIAQQFFNVFEKCQKELMGRKKNESNDSANSAGNINSFNQLFQPVANTWNCLKCSRSNVNCSSCVYCQTTHNEKIASSNVTKKVVESSKYVQASEIDESTTIVTVNTDCPLSELFKPQAGSWECQSCYVRNKSDTNNCVSCETPNSSITSTPSAGFEKFQFGASTGSTPNFGFGGSSSSSEFVFGIKPAVQPTTFTFGLSALSSASNETTGFKPTFTSTGNTLAVFGGATQRADSSVLNFGANIQKTDSPASIFGGNTPTTDTPSSVSSIFSGTCQKIDTSQNVPIFGGNTQTTDISSAISSVFGGTSLKTDSSQNAPIFVGVPQKSDSNSILDGLSLKLAAKNIFGGISQISETKISENSETSNATLVSGAPQSVFNFGSGTAKNDSTEFRFGSPQKYEFNFSGVRPRSPTKTPKSPRSPEAPSDIEDEEENESFDADSIYFQPVIPLPPKVDVKTGEENENTLFCKRAKLFRFCSGEWKERGIGDMKILYDEDGKKVRFLMRRDQVLKVCLNHYLTKGITFEKRNDKTLSWAVKDFSEIEPSDEIFAVRFKTSEFADEFKTAIDNALELIDKQNNALDVSKAASTFSFKTDSFPKRDSSNSAGPLSSRFGSSPSFGNSESSKETLFAFSLKDKPANSIFFGNQNVSFGKDCVAKETSEVDDEIQVVYEAKPTSEDIILAEQYQLPPTFYLYKNKPPCPGCYGCDEVIPPPKNVIEPEISTKVTSTTSINESPTPPQEPDNTLFKTDNSIGFGDLASKSGSVVEFGSTQKKGFDGAGTPLFANLNNSTEADGDDDTIAQGPDIHFKPAIPLPELVDIKTGEEEETIIFVHRAKLFKFDNEKKEWKERGIGDIKILKQKEKLRFRIILRREQVHKIACNHLIQSDMALSPLSTSVTAVCWTAIDYSEGNEELCKFAVKFKNKELLEQFKQKFSECQNNLKLAEFDPGLVHSSTEDNQNISKVEASAKEVNEFSDSESSTESQNDHGHSDSETNEVEEDSDDDSVVFEKRCTFEISEDDKDFKSVGMGTLKILYDDGIFGYHVYMMSDNCQCVCEHIIALQTTLRIEKEKATWAAIDLSLDPPRRRRFRAIFSSIHAVKEFSSVFKDGKEAAINSGIVEKTECILSPPGHQA